MSSRDSLSHCLDRHVLPRTYRISLIGRTVAHARVEHSGVKPGNRVLIRSGKPSRLVAAWLSAPKAGAGVVNTMPMLRAAN